MKNKTKIIAAAGMSAGLLLGAVGVAGAAHGGAITEGRFSGRAEVNNDATNRRIVGDPNGRGEAYVTSPGGGTICYELEVSKIGTATAAHIHEAAAGRSGPVVVTLSAPANGASEGCIEVGEKLAADITLRESSNYYVNVHNAEYPNGAVRAQLGN